MFDSVKEALDLVAVFVEVLINGTGFFGIGSGRNDYCRFTPSDDCSKVAAVVALVRYHGSRHILSQERLCLPVVRLLTSREDKPAGVAKGVAAGMYLGAEAPSAAA